MKIIYKFFLTILFLPYVLAAQGLPVVLEADDGELGSDFNIIAESGVRFIRPETNFMNGSYPGSETKMATYSVQFAEIGDYHLYAKVRVGSENYNNDSFFLAKNFGDVSPTSASDWHVVNGLVPVGHTNSFDVITGGGNVGVMIWKWVNISEFINPDSPVIYSVEDIESHKRISIGSREENFDIDKIAFAKADLQYTVNNLEMVQPGSFIGGFPNEAYRKVKTYVDPILPGAHPDKTLMRVGDDFYFTGSSFHITPYVPIYHSTDLIHWQIISRVVSPTWAGPINDSPAGGIWQGALAKFGDYFWVYFSINSQQYFSKAASMEGPWSNPVRVSGSSVVGYDNSIFVDDDGTPYMLMKNGKSINRIQKVDTHTGQLTGSVINLDWINAEGQYSWAEGPVMVKRKDWYYYFVAGNVGGGQWVLRTPTLTDDPEQWEELGSFFQTITDPKASFRGPNHLTQPVQISDGTWWAFSQSFQSLGQDNWSGKGRQGLLHQVLWDEQGKPSGTAPTSKPQLKPNLPKLGIPWNLPRSDHFYDNDLKLTWYFLNRSAASNYALNEREGWLTLDPKNDKTHILQKEGDYYYSLTTRLEFDATQSGEEAGLYLTNGNESVTAKVYSGFSNGKKISFCFNNELTGVETKFEVENKVGNVLWLKVERDYHTLRGYYSSNSIEWTQIGSEIVVTDLDKEQPDYNWWIGTSNGLFTSKKKAYFDQYIYKDGFFGLPAIGYNNYFGVEKINSGKNVAVTNTSEKGGWLMIGGVDLGDDLRVPAAVKVEVASVLGGTLEIWIDDIEDAGTKIAEINITNTGGETKWENFSAELSGISGQHDLFLRWNGPASSFSVKTIRFKYSNSFISAIHSEVYAKGGGWNVFPNPFNRTFTVETNFTKSIYTLSNLNGVIVEQGVIKGNSQKLGHKLLPGFYLLKLVSDNNSEVVKLQKTN